MGRPRTVFKVECQVSHGPNYVRGLCQKCYDKQRRIDKINQRDGLAEPVLEPRVTRYEQWLDYEQCGYSEQIVAEKMGIKLASLRKLIADGRRREQL